jgi:hypothetical protein
MRKNNNYMSIIISKLLKNFHEYDQLSRREIIKQQGTPKLVDAPDKLPFYVFKGECEERARIVLFLIKNKALLQRDDYHYAASIIINVGNLEYFKLAYKLIKKYRELGGKGKWGFYDTYFERQKWGKSREEVYQEIAKEIKMDPRKLESY